jgi:hypothetical protein
MSRQEPPVDHDAIERVVLDEVLIEHPVFLTEEEIVRSCNPWGEPLREDAIRLAIRELIGAGTAKGGERRCSRPWPLPTTAGWSRRRDRGRRKHTDRKCDEGLEMPIGERGVPPGRSISRADPPQLNYVTLTGTLLAEPQWARSPRGGPSSCCAWVSRFATPNGPMTCGPLRGAGWKSRRLSRGESRSFGSVGLSW